MKTREEIERLADDTLNSIGSIQPVEANSFLFGKIQHRMQMARHHEHGVSVKILSRLSVALLVFIGLNVASYYYLSAPTINKQPAKVQQKTTVAQDIATDYNLTTGSYNY